VSLSARSDQKKKKVGIISQGWGFELRISWEKEKGPNQSAAAWMVSRDGLPAT
jgi:hypothetical protein